MTEILPSQSSSLDDWLCYLESVHPANIEMGLERIKQVADSVNLLNSSSKIIMIAGTNGKGTTARCLESLLLAQGSSGGTYASPHLIRYNERVRVNGKELDDQYHVDAFDLLEKGRGETPLTYFEFGTLGALAIFKRCEVDYVLLEVGLGGRFDATNIVEPIASVITTIDLDHKEYLGDTRELVGYDKAGIFRADKPAIVGDLNIPHTVTEYGDEISAELILSKRDFFFEPKQSSFVWRYKSHSFEFKKPSIPAQNVATALTLMARLELLPELAVIEKCLADLKDIITLSDFVLRSSLQEPTRVLSMFEDGSIYQLETPDYQHIVTTQLAECRTEDDLHRELRLIRLMQMSKIAFADLVLDIPLDESLKRLSELADALILGALAWLTEFCHQKWGVPTNKEGKTQPLLVYGMGKLGGKELNFSSGIDLIFAYQESGYTKGAR